MALADDLDALYALGEAQDAYTTGAAANLALRTAAASCSAQVAAIVTSASAAVAGTVFDGPDSVIAATIAAGDLARAVAAQAWLTNLLTVLNRA